MELEDFLLRYKKTFHLAKKKDELTIHFSAAEYLTYAVSVENQKEIKGNEKNTDRH